MDRVRRVLRVPIATHLLAWVASLQGGRCAVLLPAQWWALSVPDVVLNQVEALGILAIGWGMGVTGWLVSGHQAVACFLVKLPRAWMLRRRNVLTSAVPILKYIFAGGLLLGLGGLLAHQVWGLWTQAYDIGLLLGAGTGLVHSVVRMRTLDRPIDFLEANQRYVNEEETPLFSEYSP